MRGFVAHLFAIFAHLGGFGLLFMGILDSSFLFMPLGNDLLVVAMTARKHAMLPYYAVMAAAGSVLGCLLIDTVSRKGGEQGLEGRVPRRRLEYVKKKVAKNAGWALAFAALMPPPFPFTAFVVAAAALQYPRKRLLLVIGGTRILRFSAEGLLAVLFGRRILALAEEPGVWWGIVVLVVISLAGSVFSVYSWAKRPAGQPE